MNLKIDTSQLNMGLIDFQGRALMAFKMYSDTAAKSLEEYMKEHRVWTDRTGDARKRLTGRSSEIPNGFRITLSHGVNYGIWLELAHEKRYAILEPTVRLRGPEVVRGMNKLIDRLNK